MYKRQAQTGKRAGEAKDPQPTPSQRKHQNDLVRKLNSAGKGLSLIHI